MAVVVEGVEGVGDADADAGEDEAVVAAAVDATEESGAPAKTLQTLHGP